MQTKIYNLKVYGQKSNAGFTLVELMIASVIISIVITSVYFTYQTAMENTRRANNRLELSQNALVSLERISADLRGGFSKFKGQNREIDFITSCGQMRSKEKDYGLLEVKYFLDKGLMRQEILPWQEGEQEQPKQLAPLVTDLNIKYFNGEQWLDNWDTEKMNSLPGAVQISITVEGHDEKDNRREETLKTVVPIFSGRKFLN